MTTAGQTDEKPTGRTLFGHPIGLANLFGVELWERFSFYGMLTILAYYLYYSLTDGGFTLFYLGINLGAFIGPLITGLLQTRIGFHWGFGAAAVGMALGLAQCVFFRRNLGDHGRTAPNPLPHSAVKWWIAVAVAVVAVVVIAFTTGLVKLANLSQVTTGIIIVASIAYFIVMLTSSKVQPVERTRVRAFIPLFIANAVFWSLFQQIFTVLAVYSDERMNWSIFGWTAPSSWIGSIEPVWIILLSPVFAIMWTRLGNRAPTTPRKFAYGVIGMGIAFLLFLPMAGTTGKAVPALLIFGILGVFAVSELLLSPIGLSVTTKLAPEAFRAQMMALYFFSVGLGTSMSGVLAKYYDPTREFAYFGIIGAVAIVAGVIVFALAPWISREMEGVH